MQMKESNLKFGTNMINVKNCLKNYINEGYKLNFINDLIYLSECNITISVIQIIDKDTTIDQLKFTFTTPGSLRGLLTIGKQNKIERPFELYEWLDIITKFSKYE